MQLLVSWAKAYPYKTFTKNLCMTFLIILFTERQIKTSKNITYLADMIMTDKLY